MVLPLSTTTHTHWYTILHRQRMGPVSRNNMEVLPVWASAAHPRERRTMQLRGCQISSNEQIYHLRLCRSDEQGHVDTLCFLGKGIFAMMSAGTLSLTSISDRSSCSFGRSSRGYSFENHAFASLSFLSFWWWLTCSTIWSSEFSTNCHSSSKSSPLARLLECQTTHR